MIEAKREDFDQLLEFFFESGFIYSAKRKQLQKYAPNVNRTNLLLLKSDSPIIKKVIFKDNHEIKGHISALRFFDHAWLVQHMTTHNTPGTAIARAILTSIYNFFQDASANKKVETNFMTCYYQPGNLYPEMVFGETQRTVDNPDICGISDLDFCILNDEKIRSKAKKEKSVIKCYEAQPADLESLERLLITQGRYFLIRIEGLTAERMTNLEVTKEFDKIGLYRKRRVFVAKHPDDGEAVYAVCNYSSPGCNLSELTNSFRLYYSAIALKHDVETINELSRRVLATYAATEMEAPTLLLDLHQHLPDQFKKIRRYRYWFLDTAHCDILKTVSSSILANAKNVIKRLKTENNHKKEVSYDEAQQQIPLY